MKNGNFTLQEQQLIYPDQNKIPDPHRSLFYQEYQPDEDLRPFVDCFWEIHIPAGTILPLGDYMLPHGCNDLVINLGCRPASLRYNHRSHLIKNYGIIGPRLKQLYFPGKPPIHLFGIRFKPYALASMTSISFKSLEGKVVSLKDLGLPSDWLDEIDPKALPVDLLQPYLERELLENLFRFHRNPALIEKATGEIIARRGLVTIKELTGLLGVHKSTLEDHFSRFVGIMPKRYARIIRFHFLLSGFLLNKEEETMTNLAYRLNFSDQAHMIKEFRSMTGKPPREFLLGKGWLWKACCRVFKAARV